VPLDERAHGRAQLDESVQHHLMLDGNTVGEPRRKRGTVYHWIEIMQCVGDACIDAHECLADPRRVVGREGGVLVVA